MIQYLAAIYIYIYLQMSGENWKLFPAPQYGRRRLAGSGGGSGGSYLPLTGGTMQGDINMGGFKIMNLGQNNLQGRDAVNYNTLTTASTNVEIASHGIFGLSAIFPNIATISKPPALSSIPNQFVMPLLPGLMTEFGIADTNWALVLVPNLPSYVLTANNVPGKFSAVQLTAQFQMEYQSAQIASLPIYLVVFNIDNGSVVSSAVLNITPNNTAIRNITLILSAASGLNISKLCCTLLAGVDSLAHDIVVSQTQLLRFCYLFTN